MRMSQHFLQIYFIFVLCIFIQENYGSSQDNEIKESEHLLDVVPKVKCESKYCSCADFWKFMSVHCDENAIKFIFTLEFSSPKIIYIPSKILPGYHLLRLVVDGPFITVDQNILEHIISLIKFEVRRSNIQIIPDFRFVKDSIEAISIEESHLSSLSGKNLQKLRLLTYLSFSKNAIQSIDPDVFKGTEKVVVLNLSHNLLTSIPPKILDPMKNLYNFTASHNNLLHVDGLFSQTLPKHIMLQFNNITNANTILYFDVLLFEKFRHLDVSSMLPRYKRNDADIEVLDLSYNFLKDTSATTVYSCNRDSSYSRPVFRINILLLMGNQLKNLNTCFKYTQVCEMDVSKNQIEYLTESDFTLYKGDGYLDYRKNQIRRIDAEAFSYSNSYLRYLNLSVNKITSINGSVRYLPQLFDLDVSHNLIQYLAEDEFTGLYMLYQLSLHHNQITSLGSLQQLNSMTVLDIHDNDIKLINPEQLPKSLSVLYFANNPFTCDCRFQHFIDRMKARKKSFQFDTEYCLRSKIEYNTQKSEKCPDRCFCRCTDNGDVPFMFVDCRSRNLSVVPQFFRNNLMIRNNTEMITSNDQRATVMGQNINQSLYIEDRVYGINLENNNLEFLDEVQLPANLSQLYLSGNKLKRLPESLLNNQINLQQVSLSRNPWKCDCSSIKFNKWLTTKNTIIRDIDNIRCGPKEKLSGKIIWKLTDLDLCPPTEKRLVIMVSFCILSFIILCLTAKVLYTRYELHVKVFLYHHGFAFVKEEDINDNKEFDAFISFSHDDDEFVIKEIISEIENKDPNIRLCVHYRHFMPGEFIQDNITKAVKSSKKTVIILSKNFLNSDWCLLEFRTAHAQVMEDKVHRLIVVKLKDLPKEINPIIKVYLDSTTYLTWGESDFWKKLLFILPSRSCVRNHAPRIIGDNDNELLMNTSFYNV